MRVSIRGDVKAITRDLTHLQRKQVPFATAEALTDVAGVAKRAEERAIAREFDSPTPYTRRAVYMQRAEKRSLTAVVGLKDRGSRGGRPAVQYLQAQMRGGRRRDKGLDVALRKRGVLPRGYQALPSRYLKKDRYGNIKKVTARSILRALDKKYGKRARVKTVYLEVNGRKGVWRTDTAGGVHPLLFFVRAPEYSKRYDFEAVAERAVRRAFPVAMQRALRRALATAR